MKTLYENTIVQVNTGPHKGRAGKVIEGGDEQDPKAKIRVLLDAQKGNDPDEEVALTIASVTRL